MKYKFVKQLNTVLIGVSLCLVGVFCYFIGVISQKESIASDIMIIYPTEIAVKKMNIEASSTQNNTTQSSSQSIQNTTQSGNIVASKNGKRYYYPHCGGVNRIKPENRIYFETTEQAEKKGLTLASGCEKL